MSVAPNSVAAAPAVDPYQAKRAAILAALTHKIEPVRTSPGYAAAALLVALVMILLPIVYVGFVAAVGYAAYWHAIHNTGILATKVRGKGYVLILAAYLAPIIVGAVVVLFLIKPLFARPAKVERRRSLTRDGEPLLFDFIDRLCKAVGAPRPRRIDVDLQVNASASFRQGIWSMFGNDLVLTIGLPMAAGLTCRQFAGVLAHEFGHFTQGLGMRLSYVIRSISMWFMRVVYERDTWDERLDAWCQSDSGWMVVLIGHLAKLGVKLGRLVLTGMMYVGHGVSGVMLRQMEYDADLHEIRFGGSRTFVETAQRLRPLEAALNVSYNDLSEFYRDGRLGDNLPALVVSNDAAMPDEVRKRIATDAEQTKTGFFDTHPSDRDRIAFAERQNAPGVFTYDGPAGDLFRDFAQLSRSCTLDLYRGIFGPQIKAEDLHDVEGLLAGQKTEHGYRESLDRFLLGGFRLSKAFDLPYDLPNAPQDPKAVAAYLREQRTLLQQERGTVDNDNYEPTDALYKHAVERLTACLRLLDVPAVKSRIEGGAELRAEVVKIYSAARVVQIHVPEAVAINDSHRSLGEAFEAFMKNQTDDALRQRVVRRMHQLHESLTSLHKALSNEAWPLEHSETDITLARFLLKELPSKDDLGAVHDAASRLLENFAHANLRLTGRLTTAAEKVEEVLKLPKLEVNKAAEPAESAFAVKL